MKAFLYAMLSRALHSSNNDEKFIRYVGDLQVSHHTFLTEILELDVNGREQYKCHRTKKHLLLRIIYSCRSLHDEVCTTIIDTSKPSLESGHVLVRSSTL